MPEDLELFFLTRRMMKFSTHVIHAFLEEELSLAKGVDNGQEVLHVQVTICIASCACNPEKNVPLTIWPQGPETNFVVHHSTIYQHLPMYLSFVR